MRLGIAALMTMLDVIVLHRYAGSIWQVWAQVPWVEAELLALFFIWIWSIVLMWLHVYVDFRHFVEERRHLALRIPRDIREGPSV